MNGRDKPYQSIACPRCSAAPLTPCLSATAFGGHCGTHAERKRAYESSLPIDLRLGRWQTVLAGVDCNAVICDPPYGSQTHDGAHGERYDGTTPGGEAPSYEHWTRHDVVEFVASWSPRCRGWMVALTSSELINDWQDAYRSVGRYSFAPVVCVMRGMTVRLGGDGPSSWAVYAMVARPSNKEFAGWGTLAGAYTGPRGSEAGGGRGKPDWLMQALVRDYSRPGDLVCDPFAGWGPTLAAAVSLGRRAIGSEMDAEAFAEAKRRLARPLQVDMFGGEACAP